MKRRQRVRSSRERNSKQQAQKGSNEVRETCLRRQTEGQETPAEEAKAHNTEIPQTVTEPWRDITESAAEPGGVLLRQSATSFRVPVYSGGGTDEVG